MTPRSRLRALALIPLLYALFGIWVVAATASLRHYWSPIPGYAAGTGLVLVAAVTVWQLWLTRSRAPLWLGVSGGVTLTVVLLLGRLFPFVIATTEPPPLFWRAWYPMTFGLGVVLTLILPGVAHATLRRAA